MADPKARTPRKPLSPAQVEALDRDDDGAPGGSKPHPKSLNEHELTGLFAEAFEAYDMQDERVRFDSLGRRWWFVPEKRGDNSVLLLQVKRLDEVREDTVSTSVLASDLGKPMIEDVVRALNGALS